MQDIPKLYTAAAEWLSCVFIIMPYGNGDRKEKWMTLLKLMPFLILLAGIQLWCGTVTSWFWLLGMGAAVGTMTVMLKHGTGENWRNALYRCAGAFMRAELLAALEWQIYAFYFGGKAEKYQYTVGSIAFCAIIYAVGFVLFFYDRPEAGTGSEGSAV